MKKPGLITILSSILIIGMFGCKGKTESKGPEPIADDKQLIEVRCSACHFSSRVFDKKQPPDRWKRVVFRMQAMNPDMITDHEADRMIEYLKKHNSLTEEEMMQ